MKFIDFFAGIGGFRRGMELAGHECVGFCEFDKFATASYISMHLLTEEQRKALEDISIKKRQKEILKEEYRNGEWYANDIRRVYAGDIPKADCWCFGFPCQDISVAGKQAGFQGNRSSLFFRVMYLVGQLEEEDKPTYLFIENVKNLLSVNGGWDFARLLIEMEQWGYDAEWQVLNSKDFGVPQNRERCFIVGHLRGRSTTKVFPIEGTDGKNSVSLNLLGCLNGRNSQRDRVYSDNGLAPTISTKPGRNTEPKVSILFDTSYIGQDGKARIYENICPTLTSRDYKEPGSVGVVCNVNPSGKGMNGNVYDSTGLSPTLTTNKGEGNKIVIPVLTPDRIEKRQNGRRFKENGEPMFTLTSQDRHGVAIDPLGVLRNVRTEYGKEVANTLDTSCNQGIFVQVSEELTVYAVWYEKYQCYIAIRKLTPRECFRLQGWSDDYFDKAQFVNSDSQLYKQAGNGVTVSVIEAIARRMKVENAKLHR
jgi:DNA (cytosine-5)-methyltransferase 1|nr:MAG TPA: Cytosine specific methyltransferase [Caudoviricetes sp.]